MVEPVSIGAAQLLSEFAGSRQVLEIFVEEPRRAGGRPYPAPKLAGEKTRKAPRLRPAPALKLVSPPPDPQRTLLPEGLSAGDVWASSGAASAHPGPAV